jgi:hypothetical protein
MPSEQVEDDRGGHDAQDRATAKQKELQDRSRSLDDDGEVGDHARSRSQPARTTQKIPSTAAPIAGAISIEAKY